MIFFRLFLILIHWIISLKDLVVIFYGRLMQLRPLAKSQSIRSDVAHLRKLPVHLGIVVLEDDLNVVDVAKIVVWAITAGISYVTIYDHKGHCKRNKDVLLRNLEEQQEQLEKTEHCRKKSSSSVQYRGLQGFLPDETCSTVTKGCTRSNPNIQIVGPEDGRQQLVDITKEISLQMANNVITSDDISVPFVDSLVHGKNLFPDPDLVMKFGAVDSLLGFLPWQIRLSEILSLPTHHHIDFRSFFAALDRFGYTEQRCGK